jgi:hypothetical protein
LLAIPVTLHTAFSADKFILKTASRENLMPVNTIPGKYFLQA